MTFFPQRHYHKPGTAPGTLVNNRDSVTGQTRFSVLDYNNKTLSEHHNLDLDACKQFVGNKNVTWIHSQGVPDTDTLRQFGEIFGLHPLALEDIINTGQRTKIEAYDKQYFVIMNGLRRDEDDTLLPYQISIFLGAGYVISIIDGPDDIFEPVRVRIRNHGTRLRTLGSDYLLYALLDIIVDQGFPLLENMGERLEALEDELLDNPGPEKLDNIHIAKRELILIRRSIWPQREVLNSIIRDNNPLISNKTQLYYRDCYDHAVQNLELTEAYREMAGGMLDIYLSSISNRMNDIMRVLTTIATIFIPLTFIVGVYGMNFSYIPELHWRYGYFLVWGIMIAVSVGMYIYFKRKKWF